MESETQSTSDSSSRGTGRGRGRGKSRGGLGKYLRARGRGHRGGGRPAVFNQRLLLEGEGPDDEEEEAAKAELAIKYSRRNLGTNADRYAEEEPELGSDGEPIVEPDVDLSDFLERQRITDDAAPALSLAKPEDGEEIDTSLAHISSKSSKPIVDRKGKTQQIEWDRELDDLNRVKAAADAQRDLKSRFKAKSEKLKAKPVLKTSRDRQADTYEQAPELPGSNPQPKGSKAEMEDFLDDLLG
ncbi:hypothetical protein FA15DRAFT_244372 [Coprinopsis marcescibilis]|uniref:Uncharacterized protein n=1 Tax=Coprinopsis marcescibilis TaxID=230819 RepID=A0A5C3L2V9_COPMA|nr:hypothetical protein FA15DRAFT_244372 [Coprinopsis marcescibilis]